MELESRPELDFFVKSPIHWDLNTIYHRLFISNDLNDKIYSILKPMYDIGEGIGALPKEENIEWN